MKAYIHFVLLFVSLGFVHNVLAQPVRNTYRFYGSLSTTENDCAPGLVPAKGLNSHCQAASAATGGSFLNDRIAPGSVVRTVYHTNKNWGLKYLNSTGVIGSSYTVQMYVRVTNFGSLWTRVIDFSNGTSDNGIYFTNYGTPSPTTSRCLNFYPNGNFGPCPYFNDSTYYLLTITRSNATKKVDIYVNEQLFTSYNDVANFYVSTGNNPIYIFRDDPVGSTCEDGQANFAYLSFANFYSTAADVATVFQNLNAIANTADFDIVPASPCKGNAAIITYTGNIQASAMQYAFNWNWDGATVLSGSGIGPYSLVWNTAGPKNILLNISGGDCGSPINNSKQIVVGTTVADTISASICQGQAYVLPNGGNATLAGDYWDTLHRPNACDSIVLTRLSVRQLFNSNKNIHICAGQSYILPSGAVATSNGIFKDTVRYVAGCDSLITTLNLVIGQSNHESINAATCNGSSYALPSGLVVSAAGVYNDTLKASTGCDSVVYSINLTLQTATHTNIAATKCAGSAFTLPSGNVVALAGNYADTLKSVNGCDSVIAHISLSDFSAVNIANSATICWGQQFVLPNGNVVASAGIYKDTLRAVNGCDSLIRTTTLNQYAAVVRNNISATLCNGQSYTLPWGAIVNATGNYADTIRYSSTCDSLITTVQILAQTGNIIETNASFCEGENFVLPSGQVVSVGGVYLDTIKSVLGCDSIVHKTNLVKNAKPLINIFMSNDISCANSTTTLLATGGIMYEWWPTQGLSNAQSPNPVATPAASTLYFVKVTNAVGCFAIDSIAVNVLPGNATELLLPSAFTPNDDGINDCFGVGNRAGSGNFYLRIFDRWGQLVFATTDPGKCWDGKYKKQAQPAGVYVYHLASSGTCGSFIKKGTILLLR